MIDTKICTWLMENADAPIRYRVARDFLHDNKTTRKIEAELLSAPVVQLSLRNLNGLHDCHGTENHALENALPKAVRLGLHGGFPQLAAAVGPYIDAFKKSFTGAPFRNRHTCLEFTVTANMLCMAGIQDETVIGYLLGSLDELYAFVRQGIYDIYISPDDEALAELRVPKTLKSWENNGAIIKPDPLNQYSFCYPLIYDIIGLHKLYGVHSPETDKKINSVIDYISKDDFHGRIVKGYGVVMTSGKPKFYGIAWCPQFPGWFDIAAYIENSNDCNAFNGAHTTNPYVPKLLFFAEHISNYPIAVKTKWFSDLVGCLETHRTENGRYEFPKEWPPEKKGYSVGGSRMSFGENRRKKNWLEIESTFYMLLLCQNI